MIRIDGTRLATEAVVMRAVSDRLLARTVAVFGAAQAHHGYLFANTRGTRLKLLVNDGFGVWCATCRLHQGRFRCTTLTTDRSVALTRAQFDDALIVGLPWARLERIQRAAYV
jgi:transposase